MLRDCNAHRVITDAQSMPLDIGRAARTVPIAIWRALVARDRHCTAPGCDQPPGWCEAHHITHWQDGGPTALHNLKLLCWRHHRDHHEGRANGARAPTR
jgi:HNH endonuclease